MNYLPDMHKKSTLRSIINFNEKIIKYGKVKPNGSTSKRLLELKAMYVNSTK